MPPDPAPPPATVPTLGSVNSPTTGPAVLIIEDDEGIGGGLLRALGGQGYRPLWCQTVAQARIQALLDIDVVLLDLGLPDGDGLNLCRQLRRQRAELPIIILTARSAETDIVVGLDAGAIDYLVKPFRLAELLARLRAHTRRHPDVPAEPDVLTVGDLTVDVAARRLHRAGVEVQPRAKEFDLLTVLMRHAGKVVTRAMAMSQVWDENWYGSTKTLDVHIAALRQRLGESGPDNSRITTLRGVGYRLELPPEDGQDR